MTNRNYVVSLSFYFALFLATKPGFTLSLSAWLASCGRNPLNTPCCKHFQKPYGLCVNPVWKMWAWMRWADRGRKVRHTRSVRVAIRRQYKMLGYLIGRTKAICPVCRLPLLRSENRAEKGFIFPFTLPPHIHLFIKKQISVRSNLVGNSNQIVESS